MSKLATALISSKKESDSAHRGPPPGIRDAAERRSGLIHLHGVHESGEGEDAHGDEQKQAAHLNNSSGAKVSQSRGQVREPDNIKSISYNLFVVHFIDVFGLTSEKLLHVQLQF